MSSVYRELNLNILNKKDIREINPILLKPKDIISIYYPI